MTITLKRTVNLSEPILPEVLPAPLYEGEKNAHTFMITAEKDKLPHALSGSVVAYFERNDGNTVRVEGETKDGAAILTLSPECYQTGVFYLAVMLISDGAQTVIYAASGRVRNTQDGEIIDGGNTIPTYDEIMAHLEKYLSTDITAKVEETEDGALIIMKDVVNGETTAVVKNGKPGAEGDAGATFRPAVSENGILSWTNDKNLENPEPVNIKGPEGEPGKNGVSPTAKVKETAEGAELTVTDAEGVTKAVLKNGKDGYTPQKGIDYFDGKPGENGYTPVKGVDYFDGKNGEPGEPGFSPTAKVTQTADGARIEITDKNGTTSAIVKNGKDGADAEGGGLPSGGEPHQMLVTDENGETVWEDRTHYSYEEIDYLLPEIIITAGNLAGGAADIITPVTVEADKTYTVRYNGADYQCTPLIMPAKPILAQFGITVDESVMGGILGNVGVLDPSLATSEPFVLMVFQGTNILQSSGSTSYGLVKPLDGATEVTLSISGIMKKYKTIPKEYLPESKEIIFTADKDGKYTCNVPHDELWEMDADAIAKNARVVNGEEEYSVRGASKKTETLYGNVIQVYADLNVGKYDLPSTYHRTLIITYCTPEILGNVSAIYSERVYSLSDARNDNAKPDIPVLDGGGWMNRSVDFMEYDALHNVYTLKTMSETTKGGAMVGDGLKMVGDALTVDEGEYELIDTFTLGEDVTRLELSKEPDGKQYNFTSAMVRMHSAISVEDATGKVMFLCGTRTISAAYIRSIVSKTTKQIVNVICELFHGRWFAFALGSVEDENFGRNSSVENYPMHNGYNGKELSSIDKIALQANGSENNIKAGTVVEIWGVRA